MSAFYSDRNGKIVQRPCCPPRKTAVTWALRGSDQSPVRLA